MGGRDKEGGNGRVSEMGGKDYSVGGVWGERKRVWGGEIGTEGGRGKEEGTGDEGSDGMRIR